MIHTVKGFGRITKAEIDVFLELSCFFDDPEIKLPTSTGSWKKQKSSRKTSTSALLTMPKPLIVWITINCGNSEREGNTRPPNLPLEKSVCRSGSNT